MHEYKLKSIDKIYDGDTITVTLDLGFGVYRKERLRLYGIDTPEIRGEEREQGIVSRDWLREKLSPENTPIEDIIVRTVKDKQGKYGRYLAVIYVKDVNINQQLIAEGLATVY
jgi:micrococcal nuclease